MCKERELDFSIFIIYSLAEAWNMSPATVYGILNTTGIFDDYIITCYDTLHTLGKEYLIEDDIVAWTPIDDNDIYEVEVKK